MSGGRATVAARKGTRLAAQAGDITAIDPSGEPLTRKFLIECKHYKSLEIGGLIKGTGVLSGFWRLLKLQSVEYQKLPLLIAKQNQYPVIACVDFSGLHELVLHWPDECVLTAPKQNFYAIPFDIFLKKAKRPT